MVMYRTFAFFLEAGCRHPLLQKCMPNCFTDHESVRAAFAVLTLLHQEFEVHNAES